MVDLSAGLFEEIEKDGKEATTSEATLAEVAFILTDKRHYGSARSVVAESLNSILSLRALRLPSKSICLRALHVWEGNPRLSFPDSLAVAYSELRDFEIATFDEPSRRVPSARLYDWK